MHNFVAYQQNLVAISIVYFFEVFPFFFLILNNETPSFLL